MHINNHEDFRYESKLINSDLKKELKHLLVNNELTEDDYLAASIIDHCIYTKNRVFRFKSQGK